jgi:hypothetical protein
MLGFDEYIVDLLAAFVHLRIFEFEFGDDCPIKDGHQFITKASDRAPHLEYVSMPRLKRYYRLVGREFVICDRTEFPLFR